MKTINKFLLAVNVITWGIILSIYVQDFILAYQGHQRFLELMQDPVFCEIYEGRPC